MANPSNTALKATQNYVYSLDSSVGKGATCEVFKGIHKVNNSYHFLEIPKIPEFYKVEFYLVNASKNTFEI